MELGLYMKNYLILNELKTTIYYWLLHHKTIQNISQEISSKSLHTHQEKLSSLMGNCILPTFTTNKSITKLIQHGLSQEEADLYFSIQPDKIRKSEIFTTFEKSHCSFINNLKSEKTKNQIKCISHILPIVISATTKLLHVTTSTICLTKL